MKNIMIQGQFMKSSLNSFTQSSFSQVIVDVIAESCVSIDFENTISLLYYFSDSFLKGLLKHFLH
jgi:hypothetical protein